MPFHIFKYIKFIKIGPIRINIANLIKSETIPVLSILRILTVLDEYIIAIGGVVEGIALGMEHPRAAAIMGGIG